MKSYESYEYKAVVVEYHGVIFDNANDVRNVLNTHDADGWELVSSVSDGGNGVMLILKRKRQ